MVEEGVKKIINVIIMVAKKIEYYSEVGYSKKSQIAMFNYVP